MTQQCAVLASVCLALTAPNFAQEETAKRKHVVFVVAEREYETKHTLPAFAKDRLNRDYRTTFVHADPKNPSSLPGLARALTDADVVVLSVRRRGPTEAQLKAFRAFLTRGGGLVAIRTSSHAFDPKGDVPEGHATWRTFDRDILGCRYTGHHGNGKAAHVWVDLANSKHPILFGMPRSESRVFSSLYKSRPLHRSATPLLHGRVRGAAEEPVAWIRTRDDGGRVFYTSLGHRKDFTRTWFPRLLARAVRWAAKDPADPSNPVDPTNPSDPTDPRHATGDRGPRSPSDSLAAMRTPDDLAVDLVLAEPAIAQPVFLNFDERGRMWVVQYRQYPHPAGLRITSRDRIWRNVYDRVPPPPPHAKGSKFRGADRITIHTDTNGDGNFDEAKVFLDGLNMCTAVEHGRGGVWVLNPPYLLFYPDADRDDVPDGEPAVHLSGFGLEDSHSLANSLRWGPDGWLYGAQGSTVTAAIRVSGRKTAPIHTQGQLIWRYHPERRTFEVFAEGGGNAFGCEIDAKGRVFSGHNGGDTRGFHYPQGGYLRKGFQKHGPLSNPYVFGFFPHMPHAKVARFTHNFIVYEGGALPARYRGKLFAIDPMNRVVPVVERIADGSTFRTKDVGVALRTDDERFRPVDIKHGPDGAIYVCDWYDGNVNHYRNHEGRIDKTNGRIYRIRGRVYQPVEPFDLAALGDAALVALLAHENRWFREQARRLIADRKSKEVTRLLRGRELPDGPRAIEVLWARHLSEGLGAEVGAGLDDALAHAGLGHDAPHVRAMTARLLGDARQAPAALTAIAQTERDPEVRSQLAATAKRLPAARCLEIFDALTEHDLDRKDRYIPLQLWWALESKCGTDPDRVLELFSRAAIWKRPFIREQILWRLMRRFASTGTRRDLLVCARLLETAPDAEARRHLMDGFEQAFRGRAITDLPTELARAIRSSGAPSLALDVRRGDAAAIRTALGILADPKAPIARRETFAHLLAEQKTKRAVPVMLRLLQNPEGPEFRHVLLHALQAFSEPHIGTTTLSRYPDMPATVAEAARSLLASRAEWTRQLLHATKGGLIDPKTFGAEDVARLRLHAEPKIQTGIDAIWGKLRKPSPERLRRKIERVRAVVKKGLGDPYKGKPLFLARCASCHKLFADGGELGPNLTAYQRHDLDALLLAIVDPNAEIREGFERFLATMKDERIVVGTKIEEDKSVVVLRALDGQRVVLARTGIASFESAKGSLMPEGLLAGLEDSQLRDLFAYLRTTQPQIK